MYMTHTILSSNKFRASRHAEDNKESIWLRNDAGFTMAISFAETEQLIAELTRELNDAKSEARGKAA
jgi:hypothetical protein